MPIILLIIGAMLIFLNYKAIKKDEKNFSDVLKYKEDDITDFEVKLGAIRKDMAESLTELQHEIYEIKNKSSNNIVEEEVIEEEENDIPNNNEIEFLLNDKEEVINNINKKGKTEIIKELLDLGLTEEEICEKLSLGKGEVLLVKGLYKK